MELTEALSGFQPDVGLVLGSGLGFFGEDRVKVEGSLPYADIPGFPLSTVPGHAGRFLWGWVQDKPVICMQGRFHFYEGYTMRELTKPIREMAKAGVETLFVTNAAGGINTDYRPGDFMLIADHINLLGTNPLIGETGTDGERFPDMTTAYDAELRQRIRNSMIGAQIVLKEGVYLATTGPSFETPAEIRFFRTIGADAVGMSTVPEVIVARQLGLRVVGISCITNPAAGLSSRPLTHEEVAEAAEQVRPSFANLLAEAIQLV